MNQELDTLRPVTPLGIISNNLLLLEERASALGIDVEFRAMLSATTRLASGLEDYLGAQTSPESPDLHALVNATRAHDWSTLHASGTTPGRLESEMLSGHLEGRFLSMLVRIARAKRVLEIGVFTGYSSLAIAEALPTDGVLVACEIDAYAAAVARTHLDRSPHGAKIALQVAPALETLDRLRRANETFDFVFIDADKASYIDYYERVLDGLLATGGFIAVDNTLLQGEPYASAEPSPNGRAIAAFNRHVSSDPRVERVLVPIRDGVTLIRRC